MARILYFIVLSSLLILGVAGRAGVNYGLLGDNLPPPSNVVSLLQSKKIPRIRIFGPDHTVLNALRGSGIKVVLGASNTDITRLGSDLSFAQDWVRTNVAPYAENVRYVVAGNELIPGQQAETVLPAMKNLNSALKAANLAIPVSTAVSTKVLGKTYPPSAGEFEQSVSSVMRSITSFLAENSSPLLVNVYPYFSYIENKAAINLDYALFKSEQVVVQDGNHGYKNLFDAILDAAYSALEKMGGNNIGIVVSESGWPSAGNGDIATIENAQTYNNNLIKHVSGNLGTPKRPVGIEAYIFAMFNENKKDAGIEQNFGLFYPDMKEVYPVNFP
ncbi:hypothetical protein GIB67_041301 [Kingdonia uniflora]|uniref:Glucan endo-1,3-beta-D-glucosidase n=1 Tax=Kingdonia uniflora TaxID=39325 RepID=A0A7J7NIQ6_9MAGN|nr:hypothetical protein GIB67_041301 [Kingdonia uniflora]